MKSVEMTRDLRPFHRGQRAVLDDTLADALLDSGDATNPEAWPAGSAIAAVGALTLTPPTSGATRRRGYLTKG